MVTLDRIPVSQTVRLVDFRQQAQGFRHKLLAMGLTPGVILTVLRIAPLGDPVQIQIRGYTLSLRKKECQQIEVEYEYTHEKPSHDCAFRQS